MIILIGVTGAGKSVQGEQLAKTLGCSWLSVGELLRRQNQDHIKQILQAGQLLDDNETIRLLEPELGSQGPEAKQIIIEGFPRSLYQAQWLVKKIRQGAFNIDAIINIAVPPEVVAERLAKRGRHDDHQAAIQIRMQEYDKSIRPIKDYLSENGVPVYDIDGRGTIAEVQQRIIQALQK